MADIGGEDGLEDPVSPSSQLATSAKRKRTRGPSRGRYGKPPPHPVPIFISTKGIEDSEAKATMLGLMRLRWPPGVHTCGQLIKTHKKWVQDSVEDFRRYYTQNNDNTVEQADEGIEAYMKNQSSKIWTEEHKKASLLVDKEGGTYEDYRPKYLTEDVWKSFCEYWRSDAYLKLSNANKKKRALLKMQHSAGSRSFTLVREDVKKKNGGVDPGNLAFFRGTYTKKNIVDVGTTPAVDVIKRRYTEIVQQSQLDPTSDSVDLDFWVQATGPLKKNMIIGYPRQSSIDLLGTRWRTSRLAKTSPVPMSSSSSGTAIRASPDLLNDELFVSAIDACCRAMIAQPEVFDMTSDQAAEFASTVTGREVPGPIPEDVRAELVRVVVTVVSDIMAQRQRDVQASQATRSSQAGSHAEETASLDHD